MKVTIKISKNFRSEAKPLFKKYPSFGEDLENLEKQLLQNPQAGTEIGKNAHAYFIKKETEDIASHMPK